MDNDSESFGAHLRRLRLARGLTQEEVAERAGLSARGVSDLERGINRRARADTFSRLAAALGLDSPEQANLDRLLRPPAVQRASSRTTVPVQLTSFVGRERELAEVSDLVLAKRLVTLTGAGGIGKTRLALIVAEAVGGQFDTVTMVELAALADGDLVAHSIAAALQIGERAGEPILTTLPAVVGATRLLILLDNCEHVLLSCARVAETLLRACPRVTLLATSREPLRVGPEVVWRVPPLAHRASDQASDANAHCEAVQLFAERAAAVRTDFVLTTRNLDAVAEICRRLDGIPLAIELAAARVGAMPPEEITRRLTDRFALLIHGSRTALPRHQTLRALFDWSHDLLSENERIVFRRLGAFSGGWTLEAAQAVCGADDVLDALLGLVDKSLVIAEERRGEARFRFLETVREYARQKLETSGETATSRAAHASYFARLAGGPGPQAMEVPGHRILALALDRLEVESENLRAALGYFLEQGDAEAGLALAARIYHLWFIRGPREEGRAWLQKFLALPSPIPAPSRAAALCAAGLLALHQADIADAEAAFLQAHMLAQQQGDLRGKAHSRIRIGVVAFTRGDLGRAWAELREGARLAREADAAAELLDGLAFLGTIAVACGELTAARDILAEGRTLLPRFPFMGFRFKWLAGDLALAEKDPERAAQEYCSALEDRSAFGDLTGVALSALGLSAVAAAAHDGARAARLLGWSETVSLRVGGQLSSLPHQPGQHGRVESTTRDLLGEAAFTKLRAEGRAMTMELGLSYALRSNRGRSVGKV